MSSRRHSRELALQALYQADLTESRPAEALPGVLAIEPEESRPDLENVEFAREILDGVWNARHEVDRRIEAASTNWRLSRMPYVDRNILRLSTWELLTCDETPVSVVINEAVELAKRFGGEDSRSFVNGILDRIAFDLGRGGRGPKRIR